MASERLGTNELPLTQELLATMLGVLRAGVTSAFGAWQRVGTIGFAAGRVAILDRQGLEMSSCECHATAEREYERLRLPREAGPSHGRDARSGGAWPIAAT
jgi:hypothetical protein